MFQRKKNKHSRRVPSRKRKLFEQLEGRRLLAVDVSQTSVDSSFNLNGVGETEFSQSFTAGLSGELNDVTLYVDDLSSYSGSATMELRDGDGPAGTLLASETINIVDSAGDFQQTFTFSTPGTLTASNPYTLRFTGTGGFLTSFEVQIDSTNPYAGGSLYLGASSTGTDLAFQTDVFTNAAPTISGAPTDVTFVEDTAGNVDLSSATLADGDGDSLTLTLTASAGTFSAPADGAGVGGGVTETLVDGQTITLAGSAADINSYLDTASNIQYTGAQDVNGNDIATISLVANDGTVDSVTSTVNVDITSANDVATITSAPADISFTEDTAGNVDLSSATVADVDGDVITLTLTASAGTFSAPADGAGVGGGVTETLVDGQTITLAGAAADINSYLDTASNIQYTGAQDVNGNDIATISLVANDGTVDSATSTVNVDIAAVNDPPTSSNVPTDINIPEDITSNIDISSTVIDDVDGDAVTVTLTASPGTFSSPADGSGVGAGVTATLVNSQTITLVGSASDVTTYLDTASNIQYTPVMNASGNDAASITLVVNDGSVDSSIALINIDIAVANDPPTLTGAPTDLTFTEDTVGDVDLSPVTVDDIDGDALTLTLTASAGSFSTPADGSGVGAGVTATLVDGQNITLAGTAADINSYLDTASNVQYTGAQDVNGNDVATISLVVNDGTVDSSTSTVNVDITAVNDASTITGAPTDLTFAENTAGNVDLSAIIIADVEGDSITLTLTASAGTFSAPADGAGVGAGVTETLVDGQNITLAGSAADINTYLDTASNIQYTGATDVNGNDVATISLVANDGTVDSSTSTVNVDITAANDAPTITGAPTDLSFTEDTAGDVDLSAVTVADIDGDSLTLTLTASAGTFSAPADGAGVGAGVTETLVDGQNITLAGSAADINTYLDTASNIQYSGATDVNGDDVATISLVANDGTVDSSTSTVNVDITAVNDASTITGAPTDLTFAENTAGNVDLSAIIIADVEGDSITLTLTASAGTFSAPADGAGVGAGVTETLVDGQNITLAGSAADINTYLDTASNIQYTGATDVNGNDVATISLVANDGTVDSSTSTVNVDITAANDAPTITGAPTDLSFMEDTAGDVDLSAVTVADIDGDSLTLTLTASAGTFSAPADGSGVGAGVTETLVDGQNITLAGSAADINTYLDTASNIQYTGATDVNGDDVATIALVANDGTVDSATSTVNVDITAANDAPTITGAPTDLSFTEDTAGDVDLSAATVADIDGDSLTLTLTASAGTFSAPADGSGVGAGVTATLVDGQNITLAGSAADINTYLDTASNIQYSGATDVNGNDVATISLVANDGTVDSSTSTVNVDITAANDAPTITGAPSDLSFMEDTVPVMSIFLPSPWRISTEIP